MIIITTTPNYCYVHRLRMHKPNYPIPEENFWYPGCFDTTPPLHEVVFYFKIQGIATFNSWNDSPI